MRYYASLKEIGLRSHKGNVLSVSSIQRMLQNPAYYGMIHRLGELYEGCHEPIITKTLFDEVQQVLAGKSRRKKRKRKHEFLFTGILHCGSCGCAITAERQKGHVLPMHQEKRHVRGKVPERGGLAYASPHYRRKALTAR